MGYQCNIILTFYTERWNEEKEINKYLTGTLLETSDIQSAGNRNWGAAEMTCFAISMKDWYEPECEAFINFLKTVDWHFPKSVQLYYCPCTYENSVRFRYVDLFKAK